MKKFSNIKNQKDFIVLFLEKLLTERNLSLSTINAYKNDLRVFYLYLNNKKISISECSYKSISDWVVFLKDKAFEQSTMARKVSTLKQFFCFLYAEKYIATNPANNIFTPKKNRFLPKFLDEGDVNKILKYLYSNKDTFKNFQTLLLTELLYVTGLRVSELVTMSLNNINENFDKIRVTGKGNKERVIPIAEITKKILKEYINSSNFKKIRNKSNNFWLFPSRKSHISRQAYYYKLKNIAIKAGLSVNNISPHMLRHAFASHMLKNGADLKVIQYLLGHEDISTVQIYTHVDLKDSLEAIKKHPICNLPSKG